MSDSIYRHEAIKIITSHNGVVDKSVAKRLLLQMPSAEPQLSNDSPKLDNENGELIYRQDAVKTMYDLCEDIDDESLHIDVIVDALENLPSASRKKGKWIFATNYPTGIGCYVCSECGSKLDSMYPNFCSNCGSYNGGEEE